MIRRKAWFHCCKRKQIIFLGVFAGQHSPESKKKWKCKFFWLCSPTTSIQSQKLAGTVWWPEQVMQQSAIMWNFWANVNDPMKTFWSCDEGSAKMKRESSTKQLPWCHISSLWWFHFKGFCKNLFSNQHENVKKRLQAGSTMMWVRQNAFFHLWKSRWHEFSHQCAAEQTKGAMSGNGFESSQKRRWEQQIAFLLCFLSRSG